MNNHVPTLAELQCKRILTEDARSPCHTARLAAPVWTPPPVTPITAGNRAPL